MKQRLVPFLVGLSGMLVALTLWQVWTTLADDHIKTTAMWNYLNRPAQPQAAVPVQPEPTVKK